MDMPTPRSNRDPLFLGRWFADPIIILCVRWYVSYKLSYRDLVEMMADRGLSVSHTTLMRWTVRYAPEFERKWSGYQKPVGDSWRVDETYVKVSGRWAFLYRAVDRQGQDGRVLSQRHAGSGCRHGLLSSSATPSR